MYVVPSKFGLLALKIHLQYFSVSFARLAECFTLAAKYSAGPPKWIARVAYCFVPPALWCRTEREDHPATLTRTLSGPFDTTAGLHTSGIRQLVSRSLWHPGKREAYPTSYDEKSSIECSITMNLMEKSFMESFVHSKGYRLAVHS